MYVVSYVIGPELFLSAFQKSRQVCHVSKSGPYLDTLSMHIASTGASHTPQCRISQHFMHQFTKSCRILHKLYYTKHNNIY